MRTPIAITAIALTALLASAATVGAERLITGADIKDGSITAKDIKAGSLTVDRLHQSSRDRVYISKSKRGRQVLRPITAGGTTVASLKVPAGSYAIQSMLVVLAPNGITSVLCELDDSAGTLDGSPYFQVWSSQWLFGVDSQSTYEEGIPMTIVGVATYTEPATISLVCKMFDGVATTTGGTILAEQVTMVETT